MSAEQIDIDELVRMAREALKRADAATPGPWERDTDEGAEYIFSDSDGEIPAQEPLFRVEYPPDRICCGEDAIKQSAVFREHSRNVDFVISSRLDVPALSQAVLDLAAIVRQKEDEIIRVASAKNEAILDLRARIHEIKAERDDWRDAARSEAEALNQLTSQRR